jgi:hypothetical protein
MSKKKQAEETATEEVVEQDIPVETAEIEATPEEAAPEPIEAVKASEVVVINGKEYKQWTDSAGSTFVEPL